MSRPGAGAGPVVLHTHTQHGSEDIGWEKSPRGLILAIGGCGVDRVSQELGWSGWVIGFC